MFVAQQRLKLFNPFSGKYCRHNFSSPDTLNIVVIFGFISLWASFFWHMHSLHQSFVLGLPILQPLLLIYIFKIRSHFLLFMCWVFMFVQCTLCSLFVYKWTVETYSQPFSVSYLRTHIAICHGGFYIYVVEIVFM